MHSTHTTPEIDLWDKALPDTSTTQGTVVETFVYNFEDQSSPHTLCVVAQIYASRPRKDTAVLLSRAVETLKKEYSKTPGTDIHTSLKMALSRTNEVFKDAQRTSFQSHTLKINMAVIAFSGTTAYFSRIAHAVILRRRKQSIELLTGRPLYSQDPHHYITFHRVTEATLAPGDTLFLGTPQIYKLGEEVLLNTPTPATLEVNITQEHKELRNIGIISIHVGQPGTQQGSTIAITPPQQNHSQLKKRTTKAWVTLSKFKAIVIGLAGAALLAFLLVTVLPAERSQVSAEQDRRETIAAITVLEEKTVALIELENYEEAVQLLENINAQLTEFEQTHGATPTFNELKDTARYLSSLIPIRTD